MTSWESHTRYNLSPKGKFRSYAKRARQKRIKFELTIEDFWAYWKKPCYYCGHPIYTIGLDRIDPRKGYVKSNVVSCCQRCNSGKNVDTPEGYIKRCVEVAKRHGERGGAIPHST